MLNAWRRVNAEVDTGWIDLLWMLANLTGLVSGELQSKKQEVSTASALLEVSIITFAPGTVSCSADAAGTKTSVRWQIPDPSCTFRVASHAWSISGLGYIAASH